MSDSKNATPGEPDRVHGDAPIDPATDEVTTHTHDERAADDVGHPDVPVEVAAADPGAVDDAAPEPIDELTEQDELTGQPDELDGDQDRLDANGRESADEPVPAAARAAGTRSKRSSDYVFAKPGTAVSRPAPARKPRPDRQDRNVFARIALFVRQVIGELKKVVRPTRSELLTYTAVVLVFVLAVMAYVGVLDFAFGKLVLWAFGG